MWFLFFLLIASVIGTLIGFDVADDVWSWIVGEHLIFSLFTTILLFVWWKLVDRAWFCGEISKTGDKYQFKSGGPRRSHSRILARILFVFILITTLVTVFPTETIQRRAGWIEEVKGIREPINTLVVGPDSTGVVVDAKGVKAFEDKQSVLFKSYWRWLVLLLCAGGLVVGFEGMSSTRAKRSWGRMIKITVLMAIIGIVTWPWIPGTSGNFPWETNLFASADSVQATSVVTTVDSTQVILAVATADMSAVYKLKEEITANPEWWRYLITGIYALTLFGMVIFQVVKRKYKMAGISLLGGLLIATILRSLFLPREILMMTSSVWSLLLGVGILVHGTWRHNVINRPMEWNVDPEDSNSIAQKNYYGLWGNALFHSLLFLCLGPFKGFMHLWKIPIFWSLILSIGIIFFLLHKDKKHWEKALLSSKDKWKAFRQMSKHGDEKEFSLRGLIYQIVLSLIILMILFSSFVLKTSSLLTVIVLLPAVFILGGSYEVQIRAMLVPAIQKKPIYNRFLLLGQKYLTNGFWVTLLPAWLWRFKIISVPFARWELEGVETPEIPTRDPDSKGADNEDAKPGVPVKIVAKALAQCFNPFYFLKMPPEDRETWITTKKVLIRVLLDALRDITRRITYDQAKMQDYYQFAVRRRDLKGYPENHPLVKKYYRRAIMEIKVKSVKEWEEIEIDDGLGDMITVKHPAPGKYDPTYVGDDEEGIIIPATCSEYVDWKMETSTGCRLLELGIIDVSAEGVEKAEREVAVERRRLEKAKISKLIAKEQGEGEGDRQAAQVGRFLEMVFSQDNDQVQMGMDFLIRMVGAEKLGTLFGAVEGGSDLLRQLSAKAGKE